MNDRVLITNGQLRKSLSAVRSLGQKKIETLCGEETRMNITGFSKYCTKSLLYPSPQQRPDDFMEWLDRAITRYGITMIFPMDDAAMNLVIQHKDSLSKRVQFTVPEAGLYQLTADKWESVQLATSFDLNCPVTFLPQGTKDLTEYIGKIGYPAIVKARNGSGSRGIRVVHNDNELFTAYSEVNTAYPNPMIQQKIPTGPRYDICLLFDQQSRLISSFAQKEVRHFPVEMGPSTVQQSIHLPELTNQCAKMFESIGWTGIAEVEFMLDEASGTYYFMEINPRFWNSLELAVHCNIDFPYDLYRVTKGLQTELHDTYEEGRYCRWLLPGDILHFLYNSKRFHLTPSFFGGNVHDDILSWKDPMPFVGFLTACLRYSIDPHMWKFFFKR